MTCWPGHGQLLPGRRVPAGLLDPEGQPEVAVGLLEQPVLDPVDVPGQLEPEVAGLDLPAAVVEQGEQPGDGLVGRGRGTGRVEQARPAALAAAARQVGADGRPGVGQQQARQVPGRHRVGHARAQVDLGDLDGRVAGAELVVGAARAPPVQVQPDGLVVGPRAAADHGHPREAGMGGHGPAQRRGRLARRGLEGGHGRAERGGRVGRRLRVGVVPHDQVEPEVGAGKGPQPRQRRVVGPGGRRPPDVADAGRLEPLGQRPPGGGVRRGQVHPDAVHERPGGHGRHLLGGRGVAALGAAAAAPVPRQASTTSAMPANRGRNRGIYPPEQGGGIRQIGAACDLYREHNGSGQASAPTWTSWRPPAVAL